MSSHLQKQMSVLTEGERNMKRELNDMKPIIKNFESKIKEVNLLIGFILIISIFNKNTFLDKKHFRLQTIKISIS